MGELQQKAMRDFHREATYECEPSQSWVTMLKAMYVLPCELVGSREDSFFGAHADTCDNLNI